MDVIPSEIREADIIDKEPVPKAPHKPMTRLEEVRRELRASGSVLYNMFLPETFYLPHVLNDDEHIKAAVYGRYDEGRGVLVATDQRILFIDKKPFFSKRVNISYYIVSGVSRTRIGLLGSVTLKTREGNYKMQTINQKNARNFVEYVTAQHLRKNQTSGEGYELY